ncbi:type IV secretory system conjugative DNA transfer family protein [Candidatus Obscuribacterales bacterium]|nr:type IV secretory system conjugative DNA transfer family protein [Candidatus Obscuribacterales bacterium]
MPESVATIQIKAPFKSIEEILAGIFIPMGYRCEVAADGVLVGSKKEQSIAMRSIKTMLFQITACWSEEPGSSEIEYDPKSWTEKQVTISVCEINNSWSLGTCLREIASVKAKLNAAYDGWLDSNKRKSEDNRFGSAKWASFAELDGVYLHDEVQKNSLIVGGINGDASKVFSVPAKQRVRHGLVCGPTGCGKTSSIFVPNLLLDVDSSAVVTEATPDGVEPDLYKKTSGYRAARGHKIFFFNPQDPRSCRINPIDRVRTVGQAQDLADLIIRNTTANSHVGDQVWETAERQLLTALLMIAATMKKDLAWVRTTLALGRKDLVKFIQEGGTADVGKQECLAMFRLSSDGFLNGVMVGLLVRLSPWLNPTVIALTQTTTVDLAVLENELFTFYLAVPAGKRQMKPVASVMLSFVLETIMDNYKKKRDNFVPLQMVLDELTNFGYLPDLPGQLTILRHAGIPMLIGMQDLEQLKKVYGFEDAKIIISQPATRIFFRPNELTTARLISDQLGNETRRDFIPHLAPRFYGRKLLAPDEVLNLKEGKAICFTATTRPVLFDKIAPSIFDEIIATYPPVYPEALVIDESLIPKLSDEEIELQEEVFRNIPSLAEVSQTVEDHDEILREQTKKRRLSKSVIQGRLQRLMMEDGDGGSSDE